MGIKGIGVYAKNSITKTKIVTKREDRASFGLGMRMKSKNVGIINDKPFY